MEGEVNSSTVRDDLVTTYGGVYEQLKMHNGIIGDLDIKSAIDEPNPKTWTQAMTSNNRQFWLKAAYDEITTIAKMRVFKLSRDIPKDRKALSAKWVWAVRRSAVTGKIERFKARWVARGDLQRKGLDYKETFAPVASLITLRILLALAAVMGLEIDQMDVVSAFLNGLIDTLFFLKQPEGFRLDDSVCELHRSIYGLCQSARAWYDILNEVVQCLGFKRLTADLVVWIKTIDGNLQFIIAHVDDLLNGGRATEVKEVKEHLGKFFKLKDMASVKVFIGMNIARDRIKRIIYIDQAHYGKAMLSRYGMSECNPISIPMQPGEKISSNPECI